jgi:CubicO group peptidase (beta-lactamase class C family)
MSNIVNNFNKYTPILDVSIPEQMKTLGISVVAVAAVARGETIYDRVFYGNRGAQDSTYPYLFHLGSISKMYTGAAIHIADEHGKLRLSVSPADYLPALSYAATSLFRRIAIDDILQHRGMPPSKYEIPGKFTFRIPSNEVALINAFVNCRAVVSCPHRQPAKYSPIMGFSLLGHLLTKVYGGPFSDIIQRTVLKKLGLNDTFPSLQAIPLERRSEVAYGHCNGVSVPPKEYGVGSPSAGFLGSARDAARFVDAICSGRLLSQAHTKRLIGHATRYASLKLPWMSGYGIQHFTLDANGRRAFGHNGLRTGYSGFVANCNGLTISCLTNVYNRSARYPKVWPANFVLCMLRDLGGQDHPAKPPSLQYTPQKYFGWSL